MNAFEVGKFGGIDGPVEQGQSQRSAKANAGDEGGAPVTRLGGQPLAQYFAAAMVDRPPQGLGAGPLDVEPDRFALPRTGERVRDVDNEGHVGNLLATVAQNDVHRFRDVGNGLAFEETCQHETAAA